MRAKHALILALTIGIFATDGSPSIASDSILIREFMRVTGAGELSLRTRDAVIAQLQSNYPDVPDSFWRKRASKISVHSLNRSIETLYSERLSDKELREIIRFYNSPAGRKLAQTMPELAQESLAVATEWVQAQADEMLAALRKAGYAQ